jgi:hypothetical protein
MTTERNASNKPTGRGARRPTDAQREASRRNGTKSHGPSSEAGKRIAAMNRLAHGLYANSEVAITRGVLREEHLQVTDFLEEIIAALDPRDVREYLAAREVAQAYLWSVRLDRYQTAAVQGAAILSPETFAGVGGDPAAFEGTEQGLELLEEAIDHFDGSLPEPFRNRLLGWQEAALFFVSRVQSPGAGPKTEVPGLDAEDTAWMHLLRHLLDEHFDDMVAARTWIGHQRLVNRIQEQRAAGRPEALAATRILTVLDKALAHASRIDHRLQRAIDRYEALRLRSLPDEDHGEGGDDD